MPNDFLPLMTVLVVSLVVGVPVGVYLRLKHPAAIQHYQAFAARRRRWWRYGAFALFFLLNGWYLFQKGMPSFGVSSALLGMLQTYMMCRTLWYDTTTSTLQDGGAERNTASNSGPA